MPNSTTPKTIGNPLSWGANALAGAGHLAGETLDGTRGVDHRTPVIQTLTTADIRLALRRGLDDFVAVRSDVLFLVLIYPIIGAALSFVAFRQGSVQMLFPLTAGFALLGPVSGIALYDMSRRRESGEQAGWGAVLSDMRTRIIGPELILGLGLAALFAFWMLAANAIYMVTLGPERPVSAGAFLTDVLTTGPGFAMILLGFAVGFVFAAAALVVSLVSFPILVDRRVGLLMAIMTSVQVARHNPRVVAMWGLTVAVLLALGSVPMFLGLIVVLPVLGHATWHMYRAAVR